MPYIELSNEEKMMITRPTPDDVRQYEEFLHQRHPMLLAAIARVAEELVRDGVDLEQLLASDDSTHTEDEPDASAVSQPSDEQTA